MEENAQVINLKLISVKTEISLIHWLEYFILQHALVPLRWRARWYLTTARANTSTQQPM